MDTEGTFRPERIRPIADRFNLEADAVLDNVCRGIIIRIWWGDVCVCIWYEDKYCLQHTTTDCGGACLHL